MPWVSSRRYRPRTSKKLRGIPLAANGAESAPRRRRAVQTPGIRRRRLAGPPEAWGSARAIEVDGGLARFSVRASAGRAHNPGEALRSSSKRGQDRPAATVTSFNETAALQRSKRVPRSRLSAGKPTASSVRRRRSRCQIVVADLAGRLASLYDCRGLPTEPRWQRLGALRFVTLLTCRIGGHSGRRRPLLRCR